MKKISKIRKAQKHGDVSWFLPDKKKPFTYSSLATSQLIAALSQEQETIDDVYNAINYDEDAKIILKYYIDKGYKDVRARRWFR